MKESFESSGLGQNQVYSRQNSISFGFGAFGSQNLIVGSSLGVNSNAPENWKNSQERNSNVPDNWKNSLGMVSNVPENWKNSFEREDQFPQNFLLENGYGNCEMEYNPQMDNNLIQGELLSLYKQEIGKNVLQSELFNNINPAKSLYSNKIGMLMEQSSNSCSPSNSKNQQKFEKKVSNQVRETDCCSSNLDVGDVIQMKLAKNRESARNSRNRKKIYIELLEAKVDEITHECQRLQDVCQKYENTIEVNIRNNKMVEQFVQNQQELFQKLQTLLEEERPPQMELSDINLMLDALRYRTNSNSKERIVGVNALVDNILDLSLPVHCRYMFKINELQKDLFSPTNTFDWANNSCLNLKPEQFTRIQKLRPKITHLRDNIERFIQQIQITIMQIHSEASKVDQVMDSLFRELQPRQTAQLLLFINQVVLYITYVHQNRLRNELNSNTIFPSLITRLDDQDDPFQIDIEEHKPSLIDENMSPLPLKKYVKIQAKK